MINTIPQVGDLVIAYRPDGTSEQAIITMSLQGISSAWRVKNSRNQSYCANFTPVTAPHSMIYPTAEEIERSEWEAAKQTTSWYGFRG